MFNKKNTDSKLQFKTPKDGETSSQCCRGTPTCSSSESPLKFSALNESSTMGKKKTQVVVRYDVGFNNQLFIRGKGANLSWEKGIPLRNIKSDEWVWETDQPFSEGEFKVLINDKQYETGENHKLTLGMHLSYHPRF